MSVREIEEWETGSGRGDLCELCRHDLVVEGEEWCRGCITEVEAELDEIEQREQAA